jgi:superfamily II DNA or RNA helicase
MSFTLRDYQVEHNKRAAPIMRDKEHIIIQAPGGTGKTKQFVTIAWNAASKGQCVLILTDRINIYNQNIKEAKAIGINPDTPDSLQISMSTVYVAMAQTLISRMYLLDQFNALPKKVIVLVDECHSGIFNKILDYLHNRLTAGFTATPHYKWAKHLPKYYKACVPGEQIDWFIQHDWICTNQHIARGKKEMESHLTKNASGEYTDTSQENWFSQGRIYDGLIQDLKAEQGKFTKCMVFCASIKNAHATYEKLVNAGFQCAIGHSNHKLLKEINTTEQQEIAKFKNTASGVDILVSVSSYTTGFDFPEVDLVMLYRAFGSFILYMQSLFRANRKKPSMRFKSYDYGDNWRRHGLYYFDRNWTELWNKELPKKEQSSLATYTIKECFNCGSIISLMVRVCQYCGIEQPLDEKELQQGVLIDITKQYDALVGRRLSSLSPKELATYAKLKQKLQFAIRVAKSMRQKEVVNNPNISTNYLMEFGEAMGYSHKWYNVQYAILKKEKSTILFTDFILK